MRPILRTAAALLLAACTDTAPPTGPGTPGNGSGPDLVASVNVSAPGGQLAVGQTAQLTATAQGADGAALPAVPFTWSSDRPSVARVDASGVVTAVATGTARVSATASGKSGSADVTVIAGSPPVAGIAYVRAEQIRIINSDRTGDRLLWSSPNGPPLSRFTWPVTGLSWRPDGTELAFASDHEAAYSWLGSDIYAIRSDGQGLRRVTNPPAKADLSSYPKGTVSVTVATSVYSTLPFQIFVMGAASPIELMIAPGQTRVVTFTNVADLGNTIQPVVAIFGGKRWIAQDAPDVQPGKTVQAHLYIDENHTEYGLGAYAPLWRADGSNLAFILGPESSVRYVADRPAIGPSLTPLLDPTAFRDLGAYDRGRTAATAGKLLVATDLRPDGTTSIYMVDEGSSTLPSPILDFSENNMIQDLRWLPDGSGFIVAMRDGIMQPDINLYEYDFPAGPLRKITNFRAYEQFVRSFSISPDGRQIVYEYTSDPIYGMDGPADLYVMNRDGSDPHLLVTNASFPAWSPVRR